MANFLVKESRENSYMPIHQEWTLADETKYVSISCWTDLQCTNKKNGRLFYIKGSLKFIPNIIRFFSSYLSKYIEKVEKRTNYFIYYLE